MDKMTQTWNAEQYIDHAAYVAALGQPVVALLNPLSGEKILDLGCGDGTLSLKLASAGAIIHGVDQSDAMVAKALGRGLSAAVANGESLAFNNEFDAVFSSAALHWMKDYKAVIRGVNMALKANGRFVGELGGEGNIHALVEAMETVFSRHKEFGAFVNPWVFPSPSMYKKALEDNGFSVNYIALIPRSTPLKSGVVEWLKIFANGIIGHLNSHQKIQFIDEVSEQVKASLFSEKGWVADYVRLRFYATKI